MASYPNLTNLSWENGTHTLYIAQGAKVNINLQNYIYDADGNTVTITLNSSSLPSGLTYSNGIISGTTTSSTIGSLKITLKDSTNLTNIYTIAVKTVNPSLISTDSDESNLIHVLGATDTNFTKATTSNTKTFFELNEYDGGFSQISIVNGKVTVKDYYDDGNLTADSSETFTMTDTIGADKVLDTVSSTWAVENFTYGEAKAVTSINGISTSGLYKVDITTKVKTPGTVEKTTDWWQSGYSNNGSTITSLSALQTMLTTTNSTVWMEGDKQVKLVAGGKVVSTINDGSLNSWNDDGTYEYNKVATTTQVGTWTNNGTYLKVTLNTGEITAFKISSGKLMETSLPATGFTETMTWYYGSGVTLSSFNTKYQAIADSTNTINATGTASADTIVANSFNNILDGKAGADTLIGGLGNDTYIVDNVSDKVIELVSQGTDLVKSSATSYTLLANVENLILIPSTPALNGTGNGLNNTITGNAGANILTGLGGDDILNGETGIDTLIGGLGNDTYIVDNVSDKVTELASQGTDLVKSSAISYTLSANVENLILLGTSAINGTGNTLNNTITGNLANNILNGGDGVDTVSYSNATKGVTVSLAVTAQQDTIGAGKDTLSNFENIMGSSYADTLTGNSGANTLNGGIGADTLKGGLGSDIYYVDNIGDKIVETTSSTISQSGTDTVNSSITYVLQDDLENLTLLGTSNINGTGNYQHNILIGNSGKNILDGGKGNDILNGGAGADTMKGGGGNDTYYVDNAGDIVIEETTGYIDTVNSTISYTLTAYVDNLNLIGTSAINGIGNNQNNTITGNGANNILTGGTGADKFVFNTKLGSTNVDKITDFDRYSDDILLENSIFTKLTNLGTLNSAFFKANLDGLAKDADDYLVYETDTGKLFYDADGSGAGASILFATLNPNLGLTNTDFTVI